MQQMLNQMKQLINLKYVSPGFKGWPLERIPHYSVLDKHF